MNKVCRYLCFVFMLMVVLPACVAAQVTDSNDINVLQSLRQQNDCAGYLKSWQITSGSAKGAGISANDQGRLDGLSLKGVQLCGTLNIGGLPELTWLVISETDAFGVTLFDLPALKELHLSYIQPTNFAFLNQTPQLERLQLDSTGLSDITVLANLPLLREADLSYNHIANLAPLRSLANLNILQLYHNNISNIQPLSGLSNLEHLDLAINHIEDIIPLRGLTKLKVLVLAENRIANITALQSLAELSEVHLSENFISDVSPLKELRNLVILDLSYNLIRDLTPLKKNLANFESLNLEGNSIPLHQLYDEPGGHRWAAGQRDVYFYKRVQYLPVLDYWVIPREDLKINDVASNVRIEGPKGGAVYDAENGRVVFSRAGNYRVAISNDALKSEANGERTVTTKSGWITVLDVLPDESELFSGREGVISPAVVNTLYMFLQTHGVVEALDDRDPYYDAMWLLENEVKPPRLYWQK